MFLSELNSVFIKPLNMKNITEATNNTAHNDIATSENTTYF